MSCYGNKPADFMRLQPSGQIPVAIIDNQVYGQSNDILEALEKAFPDHKSLQPQSKRDQEQAESLLRLERNLFVPWFQWIRGTSSSSKELFIEMLGQVEEQLSVKGPFFLGREISMVDVHFAPFLERMAASVVYLKGFVMRVTPSQPTDYPAINRWFDVMETLPSYQLTKSDYYTHNWDLPPQLGGCASEAAGEPFRNAIDGQAPGSWELPLVAHNGNVEPDWSWPGCDAPTAKRQAVERVSANYEAIVKFASRGAGKKGMPPVSAPLADPNASPSEAVMMGVDAAMRIVCLALLQGTVEQEANISQVAKLFAEKGGQEYVNGVADSLIYMRDRIGVPRDMQLPAARQLRAHLNWAISNILDVFA
ncbi:hypothetical protein MPSEU_000328300 [Mayamaea pseudoterrestris]|nr:hypothetical protein MPSEU_000328300 [Mayamaea pseudoterrestris]